jgi:hypothetical protein
MNMTVDMDMVMDIDMIMDIRTSPAPQVSQYKKKQLQIKEIWIKIKS